MWKIAIIDDERHVLQGMKRVIPWDELNAQWAGEALNGEDGLDLIRETQPDIVITDIYMPVMNGLDMMEQLRKEGFNGKIIILSGYSDFEHARQALRHNVSDYVSKPISVPTLKSIIGKVIQELVEEEEKRVRQGELEHKLMLYEPFIEKEWVRSAAVGTLDSSYQNGSHLPQP
ncbi:response regulator, partial [Paenibacillus sepulcri]|nr:response regulator [Paenibacillus sepulcri]